MVPCGLGSYWVTGQMDDAIGDTGKRKTGTINYDQVLKATALRQGHRLSSVVWSCGQSLVVSDIE